MKFIKTADGWYIDQHKIDSLAVVEFGNRKGFAACAFIRGERWRLAEFACDPKSTTQFDPKEAAQAWLDDFVANLNAEEMKNGKSDKTV